MATKYVSQEMSHCASNLGANKYTIGHDVLPLKDHIVDLGVTVDPTLKYSVHINQIAAKAKKRYWLIISVFSHQGHKRVV